MLEQLAHGDSCFVTLTIADVPEGHHGPPRREVWSLDPSMLRNFHKRLRYFRGPFRYYSIGEYGERRGRAHFHAALFGVSALEADIIQKAWPHGHIHVGDLTRQSAGYIAGYVTKKMTNPLDERLCGRHPEFSRSSNGGRSRTGGMGAAAADALATRLQALGDYGNPDVPHEVRLEGRKMPWGKYLRQRIRAGLGFPTQAPPEVHLAMAVRRKEDTKNVALISAREARRAHQAASAAARIKLLSARKKI